MPAPENTAVIPYQVSTNLTLSGTLLRLDEQFERAAAQNLDTALQGADGDYTAAERRAIIQFEKLKLIGNLGLTEILLRGKVLDEIERDGLWSILPGNHQTLESAARAQGIATSTLSLIKDLNRIIFPYMQETLGWNLAETWENIGAANFRELVPLLKRIITGQASNLAQVNTTAENFMNDVRTQAEEQGLTLAPQEVQRQAVENLLELGQLPNRQLRTHVRPSRTEPVHLYVMAIGGRRVIVTEATEDQWVMVQRKMSGYFDATPVEPQAFRRSQFFRDLSEA